MFVGTWLPVPCPSSEWLVVLMSSGSTWLSLQRHTGEMLPCRAQRQFPSLLQVGREGLSLQEGNPFTTHK